MRFSDGVVQPTGARGQFEALLGRKCAVKNPLVVRVDLKQALALAAVFVGHAVLFTLIYFGRARQVAACESDYILFAVPFFLAFWGYALPLASILRNGRDTSRIWLVALSAASAALLSELVGMTLAFNFMGT